VQACSKARDAKACDPALVGPDDRVPLGPGSNAERRLVRYGWLRLLLVQAQEKDAPASAAKPAANPSNGAKSAPIAESGLPLKPTTTQLLKDAEARLSRDMAQAAVLMGAAAAPLAAHNQERNTMKQILEGREFSDLEEPSLRDAILERLSNWLNWLLQRFAQLSARAAWAGPVIVWGFILAVCAGLVWGLMQLERRWRVQVTPEDLPAAGAASARDWQLWLDDASKAAAAGRWREAIHFLYWASISRLESRRLWPADRARTPREYLALVAANDPNDPRWVGLATLTESFERIWYGGRAAGEREYRQAEDLANGLISESRVSVVRAASSGGTTP
jgi:hypothetical protein